MDPQGSITAKLCAFARAYHSEHASCKIVDDYLAHAIMGQHDYDAMENLILELCASDRFPAPCATSGQPEFCPVLHTYLAPIPLSRLAFTESRLAAFAAAHGNVQYVICGAGLDTYALRNTNPNVRVFEVDHPSTQAYKVEQASALPERLPGHTRYIAVDFMQGDLATALYAQGFDRTVPAFFAIPGVSYYLPHAAFEQLVGSIARVMPPESELMFDFPSESKPTADADRRCRDLADLTAQLGEPMAPWYTQAEVSSLLRQQGLTVKEHLAPSDIQAEYFNGRDDGQTAYGNVHFILAA